MKKSIRRWSWLGFFFFCMGCGAQPALPAATTQPAQLPFAPEITVGSSAANPSTPFLRYSPDGRLFAVWTEDHDTPWPAGKSQRGHGAMSGDRAPSAMRNAYIASSSDGGKTWTAGKRINSSVEALQGEENGPKLAFDRGGKIFAVIAITGQLQTSLAGIRLCRPM